MALTISTPLMGMTLPVPGPTGQLGPTWASNLNTALGLVDLHDHTLGKGAPLTGDSLVIAADFTLNSNNLISARSARFSDQTATLAGSSDLRCVYSYNGDLYWRNGAGTSVAITNGGSIAGASGNIAGLSSPASATFLTDTFTFLSAAATPAKIVAADLTVKEAVGSGVGVTIKVPTAFATPYSLTLPATVPAATLPMTMATSGALGFGNPGQLVPAGATFLWPGASAPSGYLLCNGAAVSRTTYAAIFSAIGTAWGSGDGSTTFNLPDTRGYFIRGVDGGAGRDPEALTRMAVATGGNTGDAVGSLQDEAFKSHNHVSNNVGASNTGLYGTAAFAGGLGNFTATNLNLGSVTSSTGGAETRPKNVGFNFIIKT